VIRIQDCTRETSRLSDAMHVLRSAFASWSLDPTSQLKSIPRELTSSLTQANFVTTKSR
jgi:hypothetical protein